MDVRFAPLLFPGTSTCSHPGPQRTWHLLFCVPSMDGTMAGIVLLEWPTPHTTPPIEPYWSALWSCHSTAPLRLCCFTGFPAACMAHPHMKCAFVYLVHLSGFTLGVIAIPRVRTYRSEVGPHPLIVICKSSAQYAHPHPLPLNPSHPSLTEQSLHPWRQLPWKLLMSL